MSYYPERRFERYELPGNDARLEARSSGELINLSLSGMAMRMSTSLAPDTNITVSLNTDADPIHRSGTVKWCVPSVYSYSLLNGDPRYDVGIAFSDNSAQAIQSTQRLIDHTPVLSFSQRRPGRFELDYRKPVNVDSTSRASIRRLSLGGALVESGNGFHPKSEIDLSIRLNGSRFVTRGRVVNRQASDSAPKELLLGTEFLTPSEDQLRILTRFIRDHHEDHAVETGATGGNP